MRRRTTHRFIFTREETARILLDHAKAKLSIAAPKVDSDRPTLEIVASGGGDDFVSVAFTNVEKEEVL